MTDGTIGKNNAFFRQLLYIGILITIGLVIFTQLQFFVGSFLGAITMYVVLRTVLFRLTERWNWKPWVASLMLVLATTLLLSGLGFLIFEVIASEIPNVDTSKIVDVFNELLRRANHLLAGKYRQRFRRDDHENGLDAAQYDLQFRSERVHDARDPLFHAAARSDYGTKREPLPAVPRS